MNILIHSQGVEMTEALCLHISDRLQYATGGCAPLVEQTRLDIATAQQHESEARVQCRLTMTVRPSTTISLAVSAPTPCAAINQATECLKRAMIRPAHPEPAPAVRLPVVMRIPAAILFRRCERIPR
jgi:ribosome-associated translation inhibitor RaiA